MKTIITACGGVATCNAVAGKIRRRLEKRGIKANVVATGFAQLPKDIKTADIYVSITPYDHPDYVNIPMLNAMPFLTGIGEDEELEKLIKLLEE